MKIAEIYTLREKLTAMIEDYENKRDELFNQLSSSDEQIIQQVKKQFEELVNEEH